MIFSSPFSKPPLLTPSPNPPNKPPRSLPISSFKTSSSTFPSSTLPSPPPSLPPPPPSSFYDVLNIPMGATLEEIKVAYRKLARVCHPDVAKEAKPDEFMKIHSAYSTLSDPEKRADYDRRVLRTHRRFSSGSTGPVYSRRKWETDQCW